MVYFKISSMFFIALALILMVECGVSIEDVDEFEETERIIGGKPAAEGQFPWTVALFNEGEYICTGSIISETVILTAAHCVVADGATQSAFNFHAIAGSTNKSSTDGQYIEFKKVTVHPGYDEKQNDLAILETTAPIEFNKKVNRICIANSKMGSLALQRVVAMGWGQTTGDLSKTETPETMYFVSQRVVPNLKCYLLTFLNNVPSTILCASGLWSGVCSGDSGGPLVYYEGKMPIQVGVASYINGVAGCGHLLGPAGFTRLSSFTDYIMETVTDPSSICVA